MDNGSNNDRWFGFNDERTNSFLAIDGKRWDVSNLLDTSNAADRSNRKASETMQNVSERELGSIYQSNTRKEKTSRRFSFQRMRESHRRGRQSKPSEVSNSVERFHENPSMDIFPYDRNMENAHKQSIFSQSKILANRHSETMPHHRGGQGSEPQEILSHQQRSYQEKDSLHSYQREVTESHSSSVHYDNGKRKEDTFTEAPLRRRRGPDIDEPSEVSVSNRRRRDIGIRKVAQNNGRRQGGTGNNCSPESSFPHSRDQGNVYQRRSQNNLSGQDIEHKETLSHDRTKEERRDRDESLVISSNQQIEDTTEREFLPYNERMHKNRPEEVSDNHGLIQDNQHSQESYYQGNKQKVGKERRSFNENKLGLNKSDHLSHNGRHERICREEFPCEEESGSPEVSSYQQTIENLGTKTKRLGFGSEKAEKSKKSIQNEGNMTFKPVPKYDWKKNHSSPEKSQAPKLHIQENEISDEFEKNSFNISDMYQPNSFEHSLIEIAPGIEMPLRGSKETQHAINNGYILTAQCISCTLELNCIRNSEYILCALCHTITPLEVCGVNLESTAFGVGLGFIE